MATQRPRGPGGAGLVRRRGRVEPVAEHERHRRRSPARAPAAAAKTSSQRGHARPLVGEQPARRRARSYSVHGTTTAASPQPASACSRERAAAAMNGTYSRHDAAVVLELLDREVGQPGAQHAGGVVEEGRRRRERPARSPVQPSRSSRCGQSVGHVDEVAAHAPDDVLVQPVDVGVRAGERAGAAQVGVDDDRLEVGGGQLARPAGRPRRSGSRGR